MSADALHAIDIVVGTALRAVSGETTSGDACGHIAWSRGATVVLADGLGHGERAAIASRALIECVRSDPEAPLDQLFEQAHRVLVRTRGAVAAIARIDRAGRVDLASVGNVTAFVVPSGAERATHVLSLPGVLGSAFRSARVQSFDFAAGDTLVMHSDGIRSRFDLARIDLASPQVAAEQILRIAARASDDASCIVVRGIARRASASASFVRQSEPFDPTLPSPIPIRVAGDAECAATAIRAFAARLGLPTRAQWEISIAVSELASNVLKFAGAGSLQMRHEREPRAALVVEVSDGGAGIGDVGAAVVDGWSEGGALTPDRLAVARGLGVGLGSVHRMMDAVQIVSEPGCGTRVVATKYLTR